MKSNLNAAHLSSEEAAIAYVESRFWPDGPVCPHCGTIGGGDANERKDYARWPVELPRLPKAFHGTDAIGLRIQSCPDAHLASGNLSDGFLE